MGKYYTAKLADGSSRVVASFSMDRARLFYEISKLAESYVGMPSGVGDDFGLDEHEVDAEQFVKFFARFWQLGWLADINDSFLAGWAPFAAGIVENITLEPVSWIDRRGNALEARRYKLFEKELEAELQRKHKADEKSVKRSEVNDTNITV